jgi:hypothetical protein
MTGGLSNPQTPKGASDTKDLKLKKFSLRINEIDRIKGNQRRKVEQIQKQNQDTTA